MGHSDPIETVAFKHEEGNEGEKIGVKRRIAAFYGGKLLKRQGGDGRSGAEVVLGGSCFRRTARYTTDAHSRNRRPSMLQRESHPPAYVDKTSPRFKAQIPLTGGPFESTIPSLRLSGLG
jgi:hypothetical protein